MKISSVFFLAGVFMMAAGVKSQLYLVFFMMSFLILTAQGVRSPCGKAARALFFPVFLLTVSFLFSVLLSLERKMSVETSAYFLAAIFTANMFSILLDDRDILEPLWNACSLAVLYLSIKVIIWRFSEGLGAGAYLIMNNAWAGKIQVTWVFNLFAPFLFARFLLADGWRSALAGLAWAASGTAVFVLFSRAGTGMFILSAAALCILHREQWKKWAPVALAMLAGLVIAALASPKISRYGVKSSASFLNGQGVERRFNIWKDTLRMFRAHPLTGTGLGAGFRRGGWHAHNVHLHILAETGILGFAAWAYFIFALAAMGVRSWRQSRSPESRALAEAFLLSGACFLALSMTENLIAPRVHQSFRMNLTLAFLVIFALSSIRWADKISGRPGELIE